MRVRLVFIHVLLAVLAIACGRSRKSAARVPTPAPAGSSETGIASWYGAPYHGRATASGEIYDQEQLTAAHRTLPFGTWVEVTNLENEKHVAVRITDRGPFVDGRIVDLSLAAAREIDMLRSGTARVRLRIVEEPAPGSGGYAVQAGAFSTRDRAEAFARSLTDFDDPRVAEAGTVWRVLVGRRLSLADANRLAEKVRNAMGEAMVVPDR
jgi:rare lipoprotein A